MAWSPCLHCDQRFDGEALNLYCSFYDGDEQERYRLVVCPECAAALLEVWRTRALYRDAYGVWIWHDPSEPPVPRKEAREPREPQTMRRYGPDPDLPWEAPSRPAQRAKSRKT